MPSGISARTIHTLRVSRCQASLLVKHVVKLPKVELLRVHDCNLSQHSPACTDWFTTMCHCVALYPKVGKFTATKSAFSSVSKPEIEVHQWLARLDRQARARRALLDGELASSDHIDYDVRHRDAGSDGSPEAYIVKASCGGQEFKEIEVYSE